MHTPPRCIPSISTEYPHVPLPTLAAVSQFLAYSDAPAKTDASSSAAAAAAAAPSEEPSEDAAAAGGAGEAGAAEPAVHELEEGVLTRNLGVPVLVVCTKCDATAALEKDRDFRQEHFDFIQMHLR
jgi:hypothetical protein